VPLDAASEASFERGFDLVLVESVERGSATNRIAVLLRKDKEQEGVYRVHDVDRATVRCDRRMPV
jgi:hypothetical protein